MEYRSKLLKDSDLVKELEKLIASAEGPLKPFGNALFFLGHASDQNKSLAGRIECEPKKLSSSPLYTSDLYSVQRAQLTFRPGNQNNNNQDVTVYLKNELSHFLIWAALPGTNAGDPQSLLLLYTNLEKYFPKLEISPYVDRRVESLISDLQHARDSISAKTERAIGDLTAAIAETHKQSTERIDELSRNREAHYETLQEKHREKINAEEERIKAEEKALREREASLNLKEPIGERRKIHEELRGKLLEQIQEFGPSRAVVKSRWSVRLANWVIIGGALGAFIYFARSGDPATAADAASNLALYFYLKLAASAALFFGFGAAYVRWEIRWLDKLADTEFQLRDKAIDVERSAWLVETVEALKSGNVDLPDGFLQLLGNNLFEPRDSDENDAENLSKFLQQLIGKKGELEARMPGGGSVKINAEGTKGK